MLNGHSDYVHWDKTYINRLASEIMPASAMQLLLAGITSTRDLGAPLNDSIEVKNKIENGEIPGPNLFVSGPFLQYEPYPGTKAFRWGVKSVREAKQKVNRLADAGVDIIKLIERTAKGRIAGGQLYWTPTLEGLWNYELTGAIPERLDNT